MGPPAKLYWEPWFRPANWLWEHCFLRPFDMWAIPMPWRCVHVRRDIYARGQLEVLRQHERVHYEQMEREGLIRWHLKYFWFLLRVGYLKNPYEIEAYNRYGG
jgi:hypothetical protein